MDGGVPHYPSPSDFSAARLELGLDQYNTEGRSPKDRNQGRQDELERYERKIRHGRADGFPEKLPRQLPSIDSFVDDHAGIGTQSRMELPVPDVHGVDA